MNNSNRAIPRTETYLWVEEALKIIKNLYYKIKKWKTYIQILM